MAHISVTGCTHSTVGGIVRGSFTASGQNHGRPTYKKDTQASLGASPVPRDMSECPSVKRADPFPKPSHPSTLSCQTSFSPTKGSHLFGYGSKLNHEIWTAGFSTCVHLPGFRFGYIFLTHSHLFQTVYFPLLVLIEGAYHYWDLSIWRLNLLN